MRRFGGICLLWVLALAGCTSLHDMVAPDPYTNIESYNIADNIPSINRMYLYVPIEFPMDVNLVFLDKNFEDTFSTEANKCHVEVASNFDDRRNFFKAQTQKPSAKDMSDILNAAQSKIAANHPDAVLKISSSYIRTETLMRHGTPVGGPSFKYLSLQASLNNQTTNHVLWNATIIYHPTKSTYDASKGDLAPGTIIGRDTIKKMIEDGIFRQCPPPPPN